MNHFKYYDMVEEYAMESTEPVEAEEDALALYFQLLIPD